MNSLPKDELYASVNSTIMKIIEYPLGTSTFMEQECQRLVKPIFDLVLPRYGFCRNIPTTINYRPKDSMRLGFRNVYYSQGITKLVWYLEKRNSSYLAGSLLRASFKSALVNIGIGGYGLFNLNCNTFHILLP